MEHLRIRLDSLCRSSRGHRAQRSLDQLDLTRSPGLVVPGLERAIEAEDGILTLAGNRLNPVALLALRRLGLNEATLRSRMKKLGIQRPGH